MKKTLFILISSLIIFTGCSSEKTTDDKLSNKGYTKEESTYLISNLSSDSINYILDIDHSDYLVKLIKQKNFNENNLKKYIDFSITFNLEPENIIFIINNNYDGLKKYDDKTLNFMKNDYYNNDNLERYLDYYNKYTAYTIEEVIVNVNSNLDYPFYTNIKATDLTKGYLILVNKYNYLKDNYIPKNLVQISSKYGVSSKVEKTTYEQFIKMYNDAKQEGLNLYIRSPYRSYYTQASLYNNYVANDSKANADTYSARPGYSEHQTGLAIDITNPSSSLGSFENTKESEWLKNNAYKYGFILRYPKGKEYLTGYMYESWHYRYVGLKTAKIIHDNNLTFEEYYVYYMK